MQAILNGANNLTIDGDHNIIINGCGLPIPIKLQQDILAQPTKAQLEQNREHTLQHTGQGLIMASITSSFSVTNAKTTSQVSIKNHLYRNKSQTDCFKRLQ